MLRLTLLIATSIHLHILIRWIIVHSYNFVSTTLNTSVSITSISVSGHLIRFQTEGRLSSCVASSCFVSQILLINRRESFQFTRSKGTLVLRENFTSRTFVWCITMDTTVFDIALSIFIPGSTMSNSKLRWSLHSTGMTQLIIWNLDLSCILHLNLAIHLVELFACKSICRLGLSWFQWIARNHSLEFFNTF